MGRPGHVGNLKAQAFYNGVTNDQIKGSNKLGIHNWADRFVGRGVLVDAFRYRAEKGKPLNPLTDERYSLDDLSRRSPRSRPNSSPVRSCWCGPAGCPRISARRRSRSARWRRSRI